MEAARATQLRALHAPPAVDLASDDDEFGLVILDQIPCVRRELVFEVCYEFLRTVQTYAPVAPQTDAQQVIKTGEVIHVRVRNEYVAHSQELPRWQNGDIADIAKVQEWLGHANISITRVYDHRKSRPKESAVFKVKYQPLVGTEIWALISVN